MITLFLSSLQQKCHNIIYQRNKYERKDIALKTGWIDLPANYNLRYSFLKFKLLKKEMKDSTLEKVSMRALISIIGCY